MDNGKIARDLAALLPLGQDLAKQAAGGGDFPKCSLQNLLGDQELGSG